MKSFLVFILFFPLITMGQGKDELLTNINMKFPTLGTNTIYRQKYIDQEIGITQTFSDVTDSSTIWFIRNKSLIGALLDCRIRVGNQKPFNLAIGQSAKFIIYSKGRVIVNANSLGGSDLMDEEWIVVEPGKEYFFEIKINREKILNPINKLNTNKKWIDSPSFILKEDKTYPIIEPKKD